ncbi:ribosome maturation factor RimP [Olsenella massiliensis]|uniref:ribosome maturation factor RimP n=1 Tax=Olsenella massiliensis TaxID=1622075 RepID=UPI00071E135B|nr:ribosome maturation factor RimP [Olsenella massiliensis]
MASSELEMRLLELLEPLAADHGVDLVDLEVTASRKAPCVRVRIDHSDEGSPAITLDEVAQQTRWISDALDAADPIEGPFTLEVSSPGLDRPLSRPRDFERFAGEQVVIKTTAAEGRSRYTGRLKGLAGGKVVVECDRETFSLDLEDVKSAKLKPTF